jgi:integrase
VKWLPQIPKAPPKDREKWTTNAQVQAAWETHVTKRGARNTQRNHLCYTRVFFGMFNALVTELTREDIEAFIAQISTKCAKLMNGATPQCLAKMPILSCPLLSGTAPYSNCPRYQPLDPAGVWSYICSLNRMYDWFVEEGRIGHNPVLPVMRDFMSRYSAFFNERRRKPRRRILSVEDVRRLVLESPIHHAIAYMLMAKCFLRIHEVLKLLVHPEYFNLEEGWIDIPAKMAPVAPDKDGKRVGNHRIIMDAELRTWMRRYLAWRNDHVRRDDQGRPLTSSLLITIFGDEWGAGAVHNFNTAIHKHCKRNGMMTGKETERRERVNSHAFRAFGTTWARRKKIELQDLSLLRGDLASAGGVIDRYDAYLERLPDLYRSYGPVLGV